MEVNKKSIINRKRMELADEKNFSFSFFQSLTLVVPFSFAEKCRISLQQKLKLLRP